jgi:hypothetical protein
MRWVFFCAAFCLAAPTQLQASFEYQPERAELLPENTSFAYRARHASTKLPDQAFKAMWFSGDDRELPQAAVTKPIIVEAVQTVRLPPSTTFRRHFSST